jgi:hypothetical protein
LLWLQNRLAPVLESVLQRLGGIDLKSLIAESLLMGDENHSLERASSLMLAMELAPVIAQMKLPNGETAHILDYLRKADRFALSVIMAASTAVLRTVENIPYCGLVTGMGGNGVNFGIRISAFGDRWFEATAPHAFVFNDVSRDKVEDNIPLVGDSTIIEAYGLGGFAAAASPKVTEIIGGTIQDLINRSRSMAAVTAGKNPQYRLPYLDFDGSPVGIDVLKVVKKGIRPIVHAGIALVGGGQAGAGIAHIPLACFEAAYRALLSEQG